MEDEIKILFNNLRLLDVDLELIQKSTRVQISSQMFQKANHKGVALLTHTLFCLFDSESHHYRNLFNKCWFPYTMVEMKEYRKVGEYVVADLVKKKKINESDLTKAVMETASG